MNPGLKSEYAHGACTVGSVRSMSFFSMANVHRASRTHGASTVGVPAPSRTAVADMHVTKSGHARMTSAAIHDALHTSKPTIRSSTAIVFLGLCCSALFTGCAEPSDRIEVHTIGEGRVAITRVPKEPAESPLSSVAAAPAASSATPSQPPPVIMPPPPLEAAVPATIPSLPLPSSSVPTDETSKQRRIDDLRKKVQQMNAEIERLKTQPTTTP
jgi:hypothetical protein